MMYKNKLVAVIKSKGKVLREFGEIVNLQFQSEYSIFLKNLSSKRAVINITVDGDIVTGDGLVLDARSEVELERFIDSAHKFKFIERSDKIENHRGIKA